ncbi:MAG: phage tail family protein [Oscillospiraceae bacterium]|nr:phage tail family protein [Oscillospiraceae bacterium]
MKIGFSFKGIHSRDMGVYASTRSRSALPEVRREAFEADVGDGVTELSANNVYKRFLYKERVFQINVCVSADDIFKLQQRISKVARWLNGSGKLIFDDLPGVYWQASIISPTEFAPEAKGRKAVLTVYFNAQPFSFAEFAAAERIPIGTKYIKLGDHIPIGLKSMLTVTGTGTQTIKAYNIGNAPTKPVITIYSAGTSGYNYTVTITKTAADGTVTEFKFRRNPYIQETVIDMDKGILTQNGDFFVPASGSFFELEPGENTVTVSADFEKTVTVDYIPRFFYGLEVSKC